MVRTPESKIIGVWIVAAVVYAFGAWMLPSAGMFLLVAVGGPVALYFCIKFFAEGVKRRLNDKDHG